MNDSKFNVPGLERIISALVLTVVNEAKGSSDPISEPSLKRAADVMQNRLYMMPRFLGLPMVMATIFFEFFGILMGARLFHSLPQSKRQKQLKVWRNAPISLFGNFVDFYEKMGVFAYFSDLFERQEKERAEKQVR